jgi:small-conductance mechanosensitive channel
MTAAIHLPKSMLIEPERLGDMAMRIGLTLLVAFVVQRLLLLFWGRLARVMTRARSDERVAVQRVATLKHILSHLSTVTISLIAIVHCLEILGWDVKPLLAGAGILGVALGFGAQTLVRDWIAGVFIMVENQYNVGDIIEVNGVPATVELFGVRSTTLRDAQGYLHFVPNGEMRTVINRTRDWNQVSVDLLVRAGEDLDRALDRLREVAAAMGADPVWQNRLIEPVRVWGVERLGAEVQIRMVVRTRPGAEAAEAARELRRRAHQALNAAGIRYPLSAGVAVPAVDPAPSS